MPSVNPLDIQSRVCSLYQIQALLTRPLKRSLRVWRQETDAYLQNYSFQVRHRTILLQKLKVMHMVKLRVVAERARLRDKAHAFHQWKMESLLEQKAMDIRQSNFLITNAKLEV